MTKKEYERSAGLSRTCLVCFMLMLSFLSLCLWSMSPPPAAAVATHLDKSNAQMACSECHRGHGTRGTTMLTGSKEEFCFRCHGLSGKASNIYSQLSKPSNHRILETGQYHVQGEKLPEKDPSMPRHASCYDCHNVHKSEKGDRLKGLRGYSGKGAKARRVSREYELCYNCHSDSANLQGDHMNVSLDFSSTNPSYHPVESFGKKAVVPSLLRGYSPSSTINCSDCHGNDDPFGPKGPHGSIYEPILKFRYVRLPGPESASSYELCYSCHERRSILGDESFKSHKVHVVYKQISCAQCHDAHGSRFNPSLIKFDETLVLPNSIGERSYMPIIPGKPRCYLSCHLGGRDYEHKMDQKLTYTINNRNLPQW